MSQGAPAFGSVSPARGPINASFVNVRVTDLQTRFEEFMATTTAALEARPDQDQTTEAIHDLCNGLIDQRAAPKSVETDVQRLTASVHAEINALQLVVDTFKDEIAGRLQRAIENGDDAQSRLKQEATKLEEK